MKSAKLRPENRGFARRSLLCAALLVVLLSLATAAWGESLREFSGVIGAVGSSEITISNRQGDSLRFNRSDGTQVSGSKSSWESLAKGDPVIVSWKLGDQPRIAHRIRVK
jgi:hypothetical protein